MGCDMCSAPNAPLQAEIEGSILNVCSNCAKFGTLIKKPEVRRTRVVQSRPEIIERVIDEYPEIIKNAREGRSLSQKDFAQALNEKESIIHKLETGHLTPPIALARKIEKFLDIELVSTEEYLGTPPEETKTEEFTLGDYIKVRKKS